MTAAFFDMDGTLLRANTGALWIRWLYARGELGLVQAVRALAWVAQYKVAALDMEAVTRKVTASMRGQSEQELRAKSLDFFRVRVVPLIAARGLDALAFHRREGHSVAILSSSTPYLTQPLAEHLGIEHVLCTRLEVHQGHFLGTYVQPACYGDGKVHWAESFALERGIDLASSYFYTDSYSDLPMLKRVGAKRVVNPDRRLGRHARQLGWPVEEW